MNMLPKMPEGSTPPVNSGGGGGNPGVGQFRTVSGKPTQSDLSRSTVTVAASHMDERSASSRSPGLQEVSARLP